MFILFLHWKWGLGLNDLPRFRQMFYLKIHAGGCGTSKILLSSYVSCCLWSRRTKILCLFSLWSLITAIRFFYVKHLHLLLFSQGVPNMACLLLRSSHTTPMATLSRVRAVPFSGENTTRAAKLVKGGGQCGWHSLSGRLAPPNAHHWSSWTCCAWWPK